MLSFLFFFIVFCASVCEGTNTSEHRCRFVFCWANQTQSANQQMLFEPTKSVVICLLTLSIFISRNVSFVCAKSQLLKLCVFFLFFFSTQYTEKYKGTKGQHKQQIKKIVFFVCFCVIIVCPKKSAQYRCL